MKSIDDEQSVATQYVGPVAGSSSALTVLRLPHRQHRTGGQTDHPLCDAAEQEVVEPGSAVCAHDDQVRALVLRDLDDLLERCPRLDAPARLDPPLVEIVRSRVERLLRPLPLRV